MPIGKSALLKEIRKGFKNVDLRTRKNLKVELGKKRIPFNPRTASQQKIRTRYGELVQAWRSLTASERESYNDKAEPLSISGWNLFLAENWVVVVGLDLIKEVDVTTDLTDLDITGLDINTHKLYLIVLNFKNPTASASVYELFVNGDYVTTNYYFQYIEASGTSIGYNRVNTAEVAHAFAGTPTQSSILLTRDVDGRPRAFVNQAKHGVSAMNVQIYAWGHVNVVTNITELRIHAGVAGAIGAGSKVLIFGYKA